jgi:TfoX/Sxy family transcriptional regulator of competence genes
MASRLEFVKYVMEQLSQAGVITSKKMFGEYGLYCDGKFFACICDDQLLVKMTKAGEEIWPGLDKKPAYEGAKDSFLVEELEDQERLAQFVRGTCEELPMPKPKKKK